MITGVQSQSTLTVIGAAVVAGALVNMELTGVVLGDMELEKDELEGPELDSTELTDIASGATEVPAVGNTLRVSGPA